MDNWFLLLLLLIPLAGAAVGMLLPGARAARSWALGVSLATAAAAVVLAVQFDWGQDLGQLAANERFERSFQLQFGMDRENPFVLDSIGFRFALAADAISMMLVLLTVFLSPLAIASSFDSIRDRPKEYYAWMLVLLFSMLGVFVARDLLLFYIFFELTLIPMFFIIGIWGGPEKRYAAGKFFLYTFAGSVFTLASVIYLGIWAGSFDLAAVIEYAQQQLSPLARFWVLMGFLTGFAVKVPLFPVHTWLPLAHTEAPTAGSVILAGVLLKLGTFGLLRLAVPIGVIDSAGIAFPVLVQVLGVICVIGIIYGALVAWVQQDIKKLVAYSSVSHLGFCVLGLFALNAIGVKGSVLYMINHGLSTGALFLVIGMIYDRYHTRDINELSGLAKKMPVMSFFFVLFVLSSIGLPGLNGFVSEFLTVLGAFTSDHLGIGYGVFAATGIILGAVYMLHMTARVIWGPLRVPVIHEEGQGDKGTRGQVDVGQGATPGHHAGHGHEEPADLNGREVAVLVPIAVLVVVLGVVPNIVLKPIAGPVELLRQPLVTGLVAEADEAESKVELAGTGEAPVGRGGVQGADASRQTEILRFAQDDSEGQ
jgi:NADH-quinone oxidoreductase subunit M